MNNYREKILEATKEAHQIKQGKLNQSTTRLNLWEVIDDLDAPVLFRPLDELWGGAITVEDTTGILINSNLPKYLQRFTLAHEIGHVVLGHDDHYDNEATVNTRVSTDSDRPIEEMTADAFASELLAAREIISLNADRNGWSREDLQDPEYIYQLSIRLGISFEATCWALADYDIIRDNKAEDFKNMSGIVKDTKSKLVPDDLSWNSYAHIWLLSKDESDVVLDADEKDIFIIELEEKASSGYKWRFPDESKANIIYTEEQSGEKYGNSVLKKFIFDFSNVEKHSVRLVHERPWSGDQIEQLEFLIDTRGGEEVGLPRRDKQAIMNQGVA